MAIVTFELEDLARLKVDSKSLAEVIDRLGMSLEGIDEKSVTIDVTPNRPDMLDIIGFARAARFFSGKSTPKEKEYAMTNKPILQVDATASSKSVQPYIAVAVVKNINLGNNGLKNLVNFTEKFCETYGRKRKKMSMGLYNFDSIHGQLKYYTAKEGEFIPLGSTKKSSFSEILKSHPKGTEYSSILGKSRNYPVLMDERNVLALIPIVNSEDTKVIYHNKESTNRHNRNIKARGGKGNGHDNMLIHGRRGRGLPCEMIYKTKKSVTPELDYKTIKIKRPKAEMSLGFYLQENSVVNLVNRLGHVAAKFGNDTMVYVPPYRLDVLNEQDVIEDMAIAYGYDRIAPMPIVGSSIGVPEKLTEYTNSISKLMVGLGFSEAINFYLTNENTNFEKLGRKYDDASVISIAYAKTEAITMLRTGLLPCLLENLSGSVHERMPQKLFETGKVFLLNKGKVVERTNFAMVSEHTKADYSEIKSTVLQFLKFAGITDYKLEEFSDSAFMEGRAARLIIGNEPVGYFGEISPKVLRNFKLEEPVVAAEVNIDKLPQ